MTRLASRLASLSSAKLRAMARLLREGAHDADARQRLLQVDGDRADRLARAPVGVGAGDAEGQRADRHDREDQEGHQRELHVEVEQDHDRADERQRGLEERDHGVGDQRVERLDVVGHARDEHARRPALVEADRHAPAGGGRSAGAGRPARAGRPSRPGRSARTSRAQTTSALAMNATTTRSSVWTSPSRMPESIAVLASGAGASDAAVPATSATNMSDDARPVGREQHHEPAQLAPAAAGAAQAPAQVVAPGGGASGLVAGRHSPAT